MKYTVVTTFNEKGYNQYASRMLDTFIRTWPRSVLLKAYAENCEVHQKSPNLEVLDLHDSSPNLVAFKARYQNDPRANGDISGIPHLAGRKDSQKVFKWDAIRFSHKVYSIFHAASMATTPWLIWMDADMVCHSQLPENFLDIMCPEAYDLCYLGRLGKFSECGLYAIQLNTKFSIKFLKEFQKMYDNAEEGIFTLGEWHDSFVFDNVRNRIEGLRQLNWCSNLGDLRPSPANTPGEGHPLINSQWGAYLDHLKGENRKQAGHSLAKDIKVARKESYWQSIR
jgi:hypothetical protein